MKTSRMPAKRSKTSLSAMALSMIVLLGTSMAAGADATDAKRILKSMSDYVAK
jgi:hypothetical protein